MGRLVFVIFLAAAVAGGWYAFAHYTLDIHRGPGGGIEYVKLVPRPAQNGPGPAGRSPTDRPAIRIATFNLQGLDDNKLANRRVSDALVRIISRFDIVAVQGVRAPSRGLLLRLVEQVNATGRSYDFAASPTAEREAVEESAALLFDSSTVEIDRATVQSVEAAAGQFRYRPLVASFRARGPAENEAFTFTLINVQTDPRRAADELDRLAKVFRTVRDNGRNEDDIILLGDLQTDNERLGQLGRVANLTAAIGNIPTTIRGGRADNILFDRLATVEFIRSGVLDLMREFDMPQAAAAEVSEHMPVWAEFSVYEGGQPGNAAGFQGPAPR